MTSEAGRGDGLDEATIFYAYGQLMKSFQMFELTLTQVLVLKLKPAMTFEQMMAKVEQWTNTTMGSLLRGLKSDPHWPEGLVDEMEQGLIARNWLAHQFFKEYGIIVASPEVVDDALDTLANISVSLQALEDRLQEHLLTLGYDPGVLDADTQAEIDKLRPTEWR
jgi:hypothetical protein